MRGHHQRVIRQNAKAAAIENHWTPQGILGRFELSDNLSEAHPRIFLVKYEAKVLLDGAKNDQDCPG